MDDTGIEFLGARDIASLFSLGADRVMLSRIDDDTVLAVGFSTMTMATGRVAWITRTEDGWAARVVTDPQSASEYTDLTDLDAMDELVARLRGDDEKAAVAS